MAVITGRAGVPAARATAARGRDGKFRTWLEPGAPVTSWRRTAGRRSRATAGLPARTPWPVKGKAGQPDWRLYFGASALPARILAKVWML